MGVVFIQGVWGPHLIVVPTSCIVNWETELKRFLPGFKVRSKQASMLVDQNTDSQKITYLRFDPVNLYTFSAPTLLQTYSMNGYFRYDYQVMVILFMLDFCFRSAFSCLKRSLKYDEWVFCILGMIPGTGYFIYAIIDICFRGAFKLLKKYL